MPGKSAELSDVSSDQEWFGAFLEEHCVQPQRKVLKLENFLLRRLDLNFLGN